MHIFMSSSWNVSMLSLIGKIRFLLYENARPHTAKVTQEIFYLDSPHLAIYTWPYTKRLLLSFRFVEKIYFLNKTMQNFFKKCITEQIDKRQKFVVVNGEYKNWINIFILHFLENNVLKNNGIISDSN